MGLSEGLGVRVYAYPESMIANKLCDEARMSKVLHPQPFEP